MRKKIVIGVSIGVVWVLALTLTYFLAVKQSNHQEEKKEPTRDNDVTLKGVSIYDTYTPNGLEITYNDVTDYKSYIQISGLKNNKIQNSINERLREEYNEQEKVIKNNSNGYISMDVWANFNNLLSIGIMAYIYDEKSEKYTYEYQTYLNFNLNDGSELQFDDLFTDKSVVNSILTREFTYDIAYNLAFEKMSDKEVLEKEGAIEDQVYQIIRDINNGNVTFSFTENALVVYNGEYRAALSLIDYGEYFAYPEKYKSNTSLFDNEVPFKNLSYAVDATDLIYYNLGYVNDNAFVDGIIIGGEDNEIERTTLNKYYKIDNIINAKLPKKSNNFTYINLDGFLAYNDELGLSSLGYMIQTCDMTKDYFETVVKEEIYKQKADGESNYTYFNEDNKNVKCTSEDYTVEQIVFNSKGRKIEKLSDLFQEDYDYQAIIDEAIDKEIIADGLTGPDVKNNLQYHFDAYNIFITNDVLGIFIDYDLFDKDKMNL